MTYKGQNMHFPMTIISETAETGIQISIHYFDGDIHRIYSGNQLIYILESEIALSIQNSTVLLKEGEFGFISESVPCQISGKSAFALFLTIPGVLLKNLQNQIHFGTEGKLSGENAGTLRDLIKRLFLNEFEGGKYSDVRQQSICKEIIYQLLTYYVSGNPTKPEYTRQGSKEHDTFSKVLQAVENHYTESVKLGDLADMFFYTPSHLSKLFVKYTGQHFSEYLTDIRLKKAMPLLLRTNMEISDISERVGFPSARAFAQAFQDKYQSRPSKFRMDFSGAEITDPETARKNLLNIRQNGLLNSLSGHCHDAAVLYEQKITYDCGIYSVHSDQRADLSEKNKILFVHRAKDLMINQIQEQVRIARRDMNYQYMIAHGLLADDMQIVFEDRLNYDFTRKKDKDREVRYDFSLYGQILDFVKSQDMYMILVLGYVPSFLAANPESYDNSERSCICMPCSLDAWAEYIEQLFIYLKNRYGSWIEKCPVLLWQVPDVRIRISPYISENQFLDLYECTYRAVKNIVPDIPFGSPAISCSKEGLVFAKKYIAFCKEHDCYPEIFNTVYYNMYGKFHLQETLNECQSFVSEIGAVNLPFWLLEYGYGFGQNRLCDSILGAMFIIRMTVQNKSLFEHMGYSMLSDFSTSYMFQKRQFNGNHGILTTDGGKKASYYALLCMSQMKGSYIGSGNGYYITKQNQTIYILFYYDIDTANMIDIYDESQFTMFYKSFPPKEFHLVLNDLQGQKIWVQEQYINGQKGSPYEEWIKNGSMDAEMHGMPKITMTVIPEISSYNGEIIDGQIILNELLEPFEIRLVKILLA